ncbi:M28 family peptidase [Horticoccus sp. 23ND18S-11]|uniref:M28 family peptidase n=1 Tax=Horticoccus sp. 23ND18S-11 TaxID=3391832 RepID=UPI0039C8D554
MKTNLTSAGLALAATAVALIAAEPTPGISAASLLARTREISSDAFEGRGPGTPGEEKTVAYLIDAFKRLGLQPGNPNGTFVQDVPLVGMTAKPTLTITAGGKAVPMEAINDFVGFSSRVTPRVEAKDTDVVFVGYGVVAPEFGWDDYKDVDVRGKTVVMLINDPPVIDAKTGQLDPAVFGGKAMTYYGRWTYKYESAAAKGAAACLIVHETAAAAYPFGVVVNSWSRENFEIRAADGNAGHVGLSGWLTLDATKRLMAAGGHDFDALKKSAVTRAFRPVPLGAKASFTVDTTLRNVESRNVVALLPGTDPQLRNEYVYYNAHWDHLGRDERLKGDQIYNGAADNAAGVAVLLEIAQGIQALPAARKPKRSIVFLSVTAEEKGLLGSRHYARNPLYPLKRTLAVINMDGANQFGRTNDLEIVGLGASTIDDLAGAVAAAQGRTVQADAYPERGSYYRSDHFEFAKVGVPAFYPRAGRSFIGQPADFADKVVAEYIAKDYHQVSDEVKPHWTFEGAAQDCEFLLQLGLQIANGNTWPAWKPGNEFKARRDALMLAR